MTKSSYKFFGISILFLIFVKIFNSFYNPFNLGINFNYILGLSTGFYFVAFIWELTDAGYLPIKRRKK